MRGPWRLGAASNTVNALAVVWTLFICTVMVMPPNVRAGAGIAAVLAILGIVRLLSGPQETSKSVWNLAEKESAEEKS